MELRISELKQLLETGMIVINGNKERGDKRLAWFLQRHKELLKRSFFANLKFLWREKKKTVIMCFPLSLIVENL
jgi:hypothetical protein